MSLVTIYVYQDLQQATLAKMKLESEGIPSHVDSAGLVGLTGLTNALGGIRLQVPDVFSDAARNIVAKLNKELGITHQ
jgi:hypothetical protein